MFLAIIIILFIYLLHVSFSELIYNLRILNKFLNLLLITIIITIS